MADEKIHQPEHKPKRAYNHPVDMPEFPTCLTCGGFCRAGSTVILPDGRKIQYWYCRDCKKPKKTIVGNKTATQ